MALSTRFSDTAFHYTGKELRPHFLLEKFNLKGNAVFSAMGSCHVATENLVDWEDRLAHDHIQAKEMVHFLGEFFGSTLREGVWIQRLWISTLGSLLGQPYERRGDDLFVKDRKLSVSIVTASPVSVLLHIGINVDPDGAPVSAIGLSELKVAPEVFAKEALQRFSEEWDDVTFACSKVRPVV